MSFDGLSEWYIQSFPVTLNNKMLQYIVYQYRADVPLFKWNIKNNSNPLWPWPLSRSKSPISHIFMPPVWRVRRGHLVIGSSVCPSAFCPSIRNSVPLPNKVQYFKFGWWYSNQTLTISPSIDCSYFTGIPSPLGLGRGQHVGFRDFCHS